MSNVQSGADANPASETPAPAAKGTSPVRLIILLLIFGVALAGLLYDYCIARPAHGKAYRTVVGLLDGRTPDPDGDGAVTDNEVQTILERDPSTVEQLPNGKIEIFSWRSGLPYRTYDLYVVYSGRTMPLLHFAATERPQQSDLPPLTVFQQPKEEGQSDQSANATEEQDTPGTKKKVGGMMGGFGGGKKAGGFGRGKKGGRKTPPAEESTAAEAPATEPPAPAEPAQDEPPATEPPAPAEPAATEPPVPAEPAQDEPPAAN